MIELLDHTADVGFEPGASTHKELVDEALLVVVFEPPPGEHKEILVRAGGHATVDEEISESYGDTSDVIEAGPGSWWGAEAAR